METTQKQAFQALNQAAEKAVLMGINANITILDTAGYLKSFLRMDNAFLGSIDIAIGKAKTAMLFRMNSEAVGEFLSIDAHTYGMVNTSGGLVGFKGPDQDFEIATAGSEI